MLETAAELADLQSLLDASRASSTAHLRSIVGPARALDAAQLVAVTQGMCTLALSTVTAAGEPRVGGIDGHFLHGAWVIGTDRSAAKARHLAARPAASAAYLRGEEVGVFTHGRAVELAPPDRDPDPSWPAILEHLTAHYGESPMGWGDIVYYRIDAHWMVGFSQDPAKAAADAADAVR